MHRFIATNADLSQKRLTITENKEIHHLTNVLRLQTEEKIVIFNGNGQEVLAKITGLTPTKIEIALIAPVKNSPKNTITLTLACAIPKKTKFETIIEKCTELGVDRIIPVLTQRTEIHLNAQRQEKKQQRYATVAINAAKQCQRNFLPSVDHPTNFHEVLKSLSSTDAAFIPCLNGERKNLLSSFDLKPHHQNVILFIGPEGDFTPKELHTALSVGCIPVTLGPNVLKVDTAAISSVACVKLLLEKTRE
jgi:16S rRNA (uracil1498-N3)-methyltransferase